MQQIWGGHTLDLVISRESDRLVQDVRVLNKISDHCLIACQLDFTKPAPVKNTISARNFRSINANDFCKDILTLELTLSPVTDVRRLVGQYNSVLSERLDKHAPASAKTVVLRPQQPWFSNSLNQLKRERRKLEREWQLSGSVFDYEQFKEVRNSYNNQLYRAKAGFFNDKTLNCGNDYKSLFRVINDILHTKKPSILPDHDCHRELAERFSVYFMSKIVSIRNSLSSSTPEVTVHTPSASCSWDSFTPVSEDDIRKVISKAPSPSLLLDPLLSWLVKKSMDAILPAITYPSELWRCAWYTQVCCHHSSADEIQFGP